MYPFVIVWSSKVLIEYYDGNIYGHIDNLNELESILFKYLKEIIEDNYDKIKFYIDDDNLDWDKFCESVNAETYNNSTFFNIKYFDTKLWINYEFEQMELEKVFIKLIEKKFNYKPKFSSSLMSKINNTNIKKTKMYKNNNGKVDDFIVEL